MDLWCFDVFSLNRAADDHALRTIVFELLTRHNLISRFKVGQPPTSASGQGSPLPPNLLLQVDSVGSLGRSHCGGSHPVSTPVWLLLPLLWSEPLASCIAFQGKVLACGCPARVLACPPLSPNLSSPAWLQFSPISALLPVDTGGLGSRDCQLVPCRINVSPICFFFLGGGALSPPLPLGLQSLSKEFYGEDQLLARLGRAGGGEGGCKLHLLFSVAGREEYGIKIFFRSCARREHFWGRGAGKKITSLWRNHSWRMRGILGLHLDGVPWMLGQRESVCSEGHACLCAQSLSFV